MAIQENACEPIAGRSPDCEDSGRRRPKPYRAPELVDLGDLRGMTCGASGPNPESGGGFFDLLGG